MKYNILICNSNMFVPQVLSTVLENVNNNYIIYTDQDGMFRLFNELKIPNTLVLKFPSFYSKIKLFKIKRDMLNQLKPYTIESITFYHTEYGELANWLIGKYSSHVHIYFQPPYRSWELKHSYSLRDLLHIVKEYILFNTEVYVLNVGEKKYFSMAPKFYAKNKVKVLESHINENVISDYVKDIYGFSNSNNTSFVLLNGAIRAAGIEEKEYETITDQIINFVGAENIYTKCHPRFDDLYGLEKTIKFIPSYIPISLILDSFDVFIGYWSTGLVEAAKKGKVVISTLDIMPQLQKGRIEVERKVLLDKLEGKGIIYFPKNLQELFKLLTEYKNNSSK